MKNLLPFYPIFRQFGAELYAFHQKTSTFFFLKNWKFKTWTSVNSSGKSWGTGVRWSSHVFMLFGECNRVCTENIFRLNLNDHTRFYFINIFG